MNDAMKLHVTLHNKFVKAVETEVGLRFLHLLEFMEGQKTTWRFEFNSLPALNLQETAEGIAKLKPGSQVNEEEKVVELLS